MLLLLSLLIYGIFAKYSNDIFHHFPAAQTDGLTDEELSIQFTQSWLTFMNPDKFLPEWGLQKEPEQLSFSSVRYQLGFTAYSAASTCYKTPAYRQICNNILYDTIHKMIKTPVWNRLVDAHWGPKSYSRGACSTPDNPDSKWGAAPTWPDPVAYQNIMYSGHLAQMLVLFETVTGNDTFSTNGFDLVYNDTTSFHYTTSKLLDNLAQQALSNAQGAIPCEPFLEFTECNEHQNVAMKLYQKAIGADSNYAAANDRFEYYLVHECPKPYNHVFEGWVQGIYESDKDYYFANDSTGSNEWSVEHWNCGYNGGQSGFTGIPNSPPRDVWVAAMAFLWIDEKDLGPFICNDGMIKILDDRLWRYSEQYDGWVLRDNVDLGIGFGTAMYTISGKQCLWFNQQAGYNVTEIEERVNGSIRYLINAYGTTLNNPYNITAPLLDTSHVDNGFGAPIMDTANMLTGMTLNNDSLRIVHSENWPKMQTDLELLYVDYPTIMVRSARVLKVGTLQFEVVVAVKPNNGSTVNTKMIVKLDGSLNSVTKDGVDLPKSEIIVNGNQLTINTGIDVSESCVFQVITS